MSVVVKETKQQVRVRNAPSPSGADLHLGNVRTFIFNYLFAKQNKGVSILRYEDTDQDRCKEEYATNITETMKWLGLSPDEGEGTNNKPFGHYKQSLKLARYKAAAEELIERGKAYRCYCTATELDAARENALKLNPKAPFKYPGTCRDRKDHPANKEHAIRFISPTDGQTEIDDLVFGKLSFSHKENQDFVIIRSNGYPLYNFSCVLDDIDQQISHIIRGKDHLLNLIPQALLYGAFGADLPTMAHLPIILSMKGEKLSKRDGSVSIGDYRNAGYSPAAIISFLVRLGWSHGDQELFSLNELVEKFDFSACGKKDGKFDTAKFLKINQQFIASDKLTPDYQYIEHLSPFLKAKDIPNVWYKVKDLLPLIRPRAKTFEEAAHEISPFLMKSIIIDSDTKNKLIDEATGLRIKEYNKFLSSLNNWSADSLKNATNTWLTDNNITFKEVGQPLRLALTGRTQSPELFQTMSALGKDVVKQRLLDV